MPAGRFGNVMFTDPANPFTGTIEIFSATPIPICPSDNDDGEVDSVKSGAGGGGVLLPPPPQLTRLTIAARRAISEKSRMQRELR